MASTSPHQGEDLPPDYHTSNLNARQYPLESIPNGTERDQALFRSKHTAVMKSPSRKRWLYIMTLIYAAFAITSWTILCHIGRGPLRAPNDEYSVRERKLRWAYEPETGRRYYRAATVLSAVAAVLTIPTAANVCAYAAVPFSQYRVKGKNLSLRQLVTLADRGWMSPQTMTRALLHRHTYGSPFLWYAAAITLLGAIVWPIQQIFLEQPSVTNGHSLYSSYDDIKVNDIPDFFQSSPSRNIDNREIVALRKALETTNINDCNPRLWTNGSAENAKQWLQNCGLNQSPYSDEDSPLGRLTFKPEADDHFLAQPPYGFNTGWERSHVPRINTTVWYENISLADAPLDCFTPENATDYIKYQYSWHDPEHSYIYWDVRACIPSIFLQSPIHPTTSRQDFDELFYLNISTPDSVYSDNGGTFLATARTTIGYFELPNYHNGGVSGPLLSKAPILHRRQDDGDDDDLDQTSNPGPLTATLLALFGPSSLPARFANATSSTTPTPTSTSRPSSYTTCADLLPLAALLNTSPSRRCLDATRSPADVVGGWLGAFLDPAIVGPALNASVFLANEAWLVQRLGSSSSTSLRDVDVDAGIPVLAPVVGVAGVVVGSVLLGGFLGAVLGMVVFAARTAHWTSTLDALAMVRVGAAVGVGVEGGRGKGEGWMDGLPGWVGGARGEGEVGRLAVGGEGEVKKGRRYERGLFGVVVGE